MDKKDNLNAALDPAVVAKIAAHYRHARAKHPYFADKLFNAKAADNSAYKAELDLRMSRNTLRMLSEFGMLSAEFVANYELAEAAEAAARGDRAHAAEECYDAITVLLRMIDVLEGRQALGDPAKDDAKTEGAIQ